MNDYEYDALELLADEKYWLETDEKRAVAPAFLIVEHHGKFSLILNRVGLIASYPKIKAARERIKALVESANYPLRVYAQKYRRPVGRVPFAENTVTRKTPKADDTPLRAFNIAEWAYLSPSLTEEERV